MPSTIQALVILALALVPGFLFMLTLQRSVSNIETSELRFLLTTIATGLLIHGLVFFWTARLLRF